MNKNIIKGIAGIAIFGSLTVALTGCGNKEDKVKQYAKEAENEVNKVVQNIANENNNAVQNQVANKTNNVNGGNTVNNKDYSSYIGIYTTNEDNANYVHNVNVLIQNYTDSYIDFVINASHGSSQASVNIGNVSGRANKKSDSVYEFSENPIDTGVCTITFTFNSDKELKIDENYPGGMNPYGGNRVYFTGKHKKNTESHFNLTDDMGNIYYTAKAVNKSKFIDLWENSVDGIELAINNDGTFCIDHYTKASEVRGTYKIEGTKIFFTNTDGKKWEGEILMQQAGNPTISIEYEGKQMYLYNGEED